MAVDMFLKIDDVKGESKDDKHKGEIEVLAWHWGMTQAGKTHFGSGGGSGKADVHDLTLTKWVDKATPNLVKAACSGQHFKEAMLTVRKVGGKEPVDYLTILMKDLMVVEVATGGSGGRGGDDLLTENITLNFAQFKVVYTAQKEDGSKDATVEAAWNIAANNDKV